MLANIDATIISIKGPSYVNENLDNYDPEDLYQKKPIIKMFVEVITKEVTKDTYKGVLKFNDKKKIDKVNSINNK